MIYILHDRLVAYREHGRSNIDYWRSGAKATLFNMPRKVVIRKLLCISMEEIKVLKPNQTINKVPEGVIVCAGLIRIIPEAKT